MSQSLPKILLKWIQIFRKQSFRMIHFSVGTPQQKITLKIAAPVWGSEGGEGGLGILPPRAEKG